MKKFLKSISCLFAITNLILIFLFGKIFANAVNCSAEDLSCNQYCGLYVSCPGSGSCFCGAGDGCFCYGYCSSGGSFFGGKDCDGSGWGDWPMY